MIVVAHFFSERAKGPRAQKARESERDLTGRARCVFIAEGCRESVYPR